MYTYIKDSMTLINGGPFSVIYNWSFLKSVICEKANLTLRSVTEIFSVIVDSILNSCDL